LLDYRFPQVYLRSVSAKSRAVEAVRPPLLIPKSEVARLLGGVPLSVVDQLITEGHLGKRTVGGVELVRLSDVELFAGRDDPEPVNYSPNESV
jgi:hypothetical protein